MIIIFTDELYFCMTGNIHECTGKLSEAENKLRPSKHWPEEVLLAEKQVMLIAKI